MEARIGQLLEHARWVRGLARCLTHDEAGADDLAQDAWVAALRRPPASADEPRGWLGAVVRNTRRMGLRGDGRRVARERVVFEPDARVASAADLADEVELGRILAEELLDLDEPYRETLLLTFYRDLTSSEIGFQRGIPATTVRTHVKMGLERLRQRLDERYGERAMWKRALVPIAALPRVVAKGVVMGKIATTTIAAVGVLSVLAVHRARSSSEPKTEAPRVTTSAPAPSALRTLIEGLRQQKPAHDALVAAIEAKRPAPPIRLLDTPRPPSPPGTLPAEAWKVGDLDEEYIRQAIQETMPLFKQCLDVALIDHRDLSGKITLKFTIEGDPEVGGVVGESEVDRDNTTIDLPDLHECFEQTIYAARFPPPADHGVVLVSYPFKLLPAPNPDDQP